MTLKNTRNVYSSNQFYKPWGVVVPKTDPQHIQSCNRLWSLMKMLSLSVGVNCVRLLVKYLMTPSHICILELICLWNQPDSRWQSQTCKMLFWISLQRQVPSPEPELSSSQKSCFICWGLSRAFTPNLAPYSSSFRLNFSPSSLQLLPLSSLPACPPPPYSPPSPLLRSHSGQHISQIDGCQS